MVLKQEQPKPTQRIWLDIMPPEVNTRIASHLHPEEQEFCDDCKPLSPLLQLADVSDAQRKAVADSFQNELVVNSSTSSKWVRIFEGNVSQLDFKASDCLSGFYNLLQESTLHTAFISNQPVELSNVSQARQLRELHIALDFKGQPQYIVRALEKLDISKLGISCAKQCEQICIFNFFPNRSAFQDLFNSCRNLRQLKIACICDQSNTGVMNFLAELPVLDELALNFPLKEEALSAMGRMKSVCLQANIECNSPYEEKWSQFRLAIKAGPYMTKIKAFCNEMPFGGMSPTLIVSEHVILQLAACTRLETLHIGLEPMVEEYLPALTKLESLRLFWYPKLPINAALDTDLPQWVEVYHRPRSSFFHRILWDMPKLKDLCLFTMRISNNELHEILSHHGSTLEVFGTSVLFQEEELFDRILFNMEEVGNYCRSLRRLEMRDTGTPLRAYRRMAWMDSDSIEYWNKIVDHEISLLKRLVPLLDTELLCDCLEEFGLTLELHSYP